MRPVWREWGEKAVGIEEIIKSLDNHASLLDNMSRHQAKAGKSSMADVCRAAITMLKTHPEAHPNEPLTMEDALEMHGEPAYLCWPDGGEWVLIRVASMEKVELVLRNGILTPIRFVFEGGGKLYRRPPKEV